MKSTFLIITCLLLISGAVYYFPKYEAVPNGPAETMLAKLKRAYPSLATDQINNANSILNYAV